MTGTSAGHVFGDVAGIAYLLLNTFMVVRQVLPACCLHLDASVEHVL
jgi:hypothetical protein